MARAQKPMIIVIPIKDLQSNPFGPRLRMAKSAMMPAQSPLVRIAQYKRKKPKAPEDTGRPR